MRELFIIALAIALSWLIVFALTAFVVRLGATLDVFNYGGDLTGLSTVVLVVLILLRSI